MDMSSTVARPHNEPPVLAESTALLLALLFTVLYIAPFYLSATLRTTPLTSRDAPSVVRARIRAVTCSCVLSTAITVYVVVTRAHTGPRRVLRLLAIWPINPFDCARTLVLLALLFVGPLYESAIVDQGWRDWTWHAVRDTLWDSLPNYRNYVVAPCSEELVFRSLVVSLYLLADVSPARIVFVTPLIFGVAHVHHLAEFIQARILPGHTFPPTDVLLVGFVSSLFQFTYTSLFGFFAAFLYLRTGNVFATIVAHAFCNFMGLPRMWGRVGQCQDWEPAIASGKADQSRVSGQGPERQEDKASEAWLWGDSGNKRGVAWTVVYYILLLVGAVGFHQMLWTLTESPNALASFESVDETGWKGREYRM